MFIDKCISKFEAYKTSTLEILGSDTYVDFMDDTEQERKWMEEYHGIRQI